MNILIINLNQFNLSKDEFVKPIEQILKDNKINFQTLHIFQISGNSSHKKLEDTNYDSLKNSLKVLSKFDKIILSGTALKDFHYLELLDEFNWIKKIDKPILGICAGCQIIGKIFGAELEDNQEIGMGEINCLKENKLFKENFKAYCLHNKSLTNLDNFEILAKSKNSIQTIKYKKIYGVLFHPEVKNHNIIENFIKNT